MRNKQAKKLRRLAEQKTIGQKQSTTRRLYRRYKKIFSAMSLTQKEKYKLV